MSAQDASTISLGWTAPADRDEIRDLNDALTAANERALKAEAQLRTQKWADGYIEQLEADLRRERDHIVKMGKAQAESDAHVDALMGKVRRLENSRANVALTEAVRYLQAELADHAKDFVHPAAAIRRNLMRAFVVEHGGKVGEE